MRGHVRLIGVCTLLAATLSWLAGCGKQPIAKVGSHTITRQEFLDKLEKDQGRDALIGMINRQLIEDAFSKSGLQLAPSEVQEKLAEIKKGYPSEQAFAQVMANQGMGEEDVIESLTLDLKVKALLTKDIKTSEDELKKFFEEYKSHFDQPELISYSEIVVSDAATATKVADQAADPSKDFAALAKQNSLSPQTRENGGLVPQQPQQAIYPPQVREALASMEVGKVSKPIEAEGRWYIVKLNSKKAAEQADFKRDRAKIEEGYKSMRAKSLQQLLTEIRETADVSVIDPKYQDVADVFQKKPELPEFGAKGAEEPKDEKGDGAAKDAPKAESPKAKTEGAK